MYPQDRVLFARRGGARGEPYQPIAPSVSPALGFGQLLNPRARGVGSLPRVLKPGAQCRAQDLTMSENWCNPPPHFRGTVVRTERVKLQEENLNGR